MLGCRVRLEATLDGVEIPKDNFLSPKWTVEKGNVKVYSKIDYQAEKGVVEAAADSDYPWVVNISHDRPSDLMYQDFTLLLEGKIKDPPDKFTARIDLKGQAPAYCTGRTFREDHGGDEILCEFDYGGAWQWNVGWKMAIEWHVKSTYNSNKGKIFAIQLVQSESDDHKTNGQWLYDGKEYPFGNTEDFPAGEIDARLDVSDTPGSFIHPTEANKLKQDIRKKFSAKFRTYLFYQDEESGSIPVLLTSAITWGISFDRTWKPGKNNPEDMDEIGTWSPPDETWDNKQIDKMLEYPDLSLPEWSGCVLQKNEDLGDDAAGTKF